MTRKIDYLSECCDESVSFDAPCFWNSDTQAWETGDRYDHAPVCHGCGEECASLVIDIETGEELDIGPESLEWIPKTKADRLWQERNAERIRQMEAERAERQAMELAEANANALAGLEA